MKKIFSTLLLALPCLTLAAQSVDGLEIGSYYSKGAIYTSLHHAKELTAENGQQLFISGMSSFYFDFTGAFESGEGRFASAVIKDNNHVVKFPFGEFTVGDGLDKLLKLRADIAVSGRQSGECTVSYTKRSGVRMSTKVKFNEGFIITEITDFRLDKVKKQDMQQGNFYNAVSSVVVSGNSLEMGFPLATLLRFGVDVTFSQYPNGVCLISTGGRHPVQYLVRYDMNYIVREILPL